MTAGESRAPLPGSVVVLSPHLDDAVLSLGAAISASVRLGAAIRVITVFAGDPSSAGPPSAWEVQCGFSSVEEAVRVRRLEDDAACKCLGATPVRLGFPCVDHAVGRDDDEIWEAIAEAIAGADAVLVPGGPLLHADHQLVTQLVLQHRPPGCLVGLYVEQPYAFWEFVGPRSTIGRLAAWTACALRTKKIRGEQAPANPTSVVSSGAAGEWLVSRVTRADRRAKLRAAREYRSQLRGFGRLFIGQLTLYERSRGGESIAWLASR